MKSFPDAILVFHKFLAVLLLCILLGCQQEGNKFEVKDEGTLISFSLEGRPVLSYQTTGSLPRPDIDSIYLRGGYIHPLYTPSGKIITGDYQDNHVHHHGIWAAWTKTEFEGRNPDFWNMQNETGTVKFIKVDSVFSGVEFAGFHATHHYIDMTFPEDKVVLEEKWEVKIYNNEETKNSFNIFDLNIFQHCATKNPLILPQYHYGGIGFRGPDNWNGVENTEFLSSEGKVRSNGNETRSKWCHIGGLVENEWVGITILNHQDNFRFPQPMRIHPDEPFFCYAPSQLGEWSITQQNPYQAKYRFVVYDGKPDTVLLEKLWQDFNDQKPAAL
ncbi:MAG: PmoA family protein [Bacteroidota bacterium]|nr:PmoA family protein [Bacteroidota bacterium]